MTNNDRRIQLGKRQEQIEPKEIDTSISAESFVIFVANLVHQNNVGDTTCRNMIKEMLSETKEYQAWKESKKKGK